MQLHDTVHAVQEFNGGEAWRSPGKANGHETRYVQ